MPRPRLNPMPPRRPTGPTRLTALALAGPNPGALAGFVHVPAQLADRPGLVVVLHGCTQNAAGYDRGSGWSTLAEQHGFILLYPEQQRGNNPNLCFNWFEPGDVARGRGEVGSIKAMIDQVVAEHGVDRDRIFVTGLSAGGAMTAAMLAAYPDMFAAGAVIAGLPSGTATSVSEALDRMRAGPDLPGAQLADRVRAASGHAGAWPRLAIWHGDADRTVHASNAEALVRQWTTLHGLPAQPTRTDLAEGHPRRSWTGADGAVLVEDVRIAGMGHGTPLAAGEGDDRCGAAAAYMLDVGISSSHGIARFFGLLDAPAALKPAAAPAREPVDPVERLPARIAIPEPAPRRLEPTGRTVRHAPASGVQGVIEKALRSAGLMK